MQPAHDPHQARNLRSRSPAFIGWQHLTAAVLRSHMAFSSLLPSGPEAIVLLLGSCLWLKAALLLVRLGEAAGPFGLSFPPGGPFPMQGVQAVRTAFGPILNVSGVSWKPQSVCGERALPVLYQVGRFLVLAGVYGPRSREDLPRISERKRFPK